MTEETGSTEHSLYPHFREERADTTRSRLAHLRRTLLPLFKASFFLGTMPPRFEPETTAIAPSEFFKKDLLAQLFLNLEIVFHYKVNVKLAKAGYSCYPGPLGETQFLSPFLSSADDVLDGSLNRILKSPRKNWNTHEQATETRWTCSFLAEKLIEYAREEKNSLVRDRILLAIDRTLRRGVRTTEELTREEIDPDWLRNIINTATGEEQNQPLPAILKEYVDNPQTRHD